MNLLLDRSPRLDIYKLVVYYASIKRELKTEPLYECRCDERLKSRVEESTVCVLDVIGAPSIFRLTRKAAALARMSPTFALSCEENTTHR